MNTLLINQASTPMFFLLLVISIPGQLPGATQYRLGFRDVSSDQGGIECGNRILGEPGSTMALDIIVTFTQENTTPDGGATGWVFGFGGEN